MILKRDQILNMEDLPAETVHVPEWGGDVLVRGLSGSERDEYEQEIVRMNGRDVSMNLRNARAKLVAKVTVDEGGNRIFSDDDVRALGKKSAAALERIFNIGRKLSGMSDTDIQELGSALKKDLPDDSLTG
jgi:hypothetical protein